MNTVLTFIHMFQDVDWLEIGQCTLQTLETLGATLPLTIILGLPLGVLLFLTSPGQLLERHSVYSVMSFIVNLLRSVPFVILLIALIPLTTLIVGVPFGVRGIIPPLVIGATPYFARLVETSLREVDKGVIEASLAMGASIRQIILNVLLPEALPSLIAGITITAITLISYAAMSGLVGGGGLGDLAYRRGYQSFHTGIMIATVILLVILVQVLQMIGDRLVLRFTRK